MRKTVEFKIETQEHRAIDKEHRDGANDKRKYHLIRTGHTFTQTCRECKTQVHRTYKCALRRRFFANIAMSLFFEKLPLELRLMIYKILLVDDYDNSGYYYDHDDDRTVQIYQIGKRRSPDPVTRGYIGFQFPMGYILPDKMAKVSHASRHATASILRVCSQMHEEAIPVLYGDRKSVV